MAAPAAANLLSESGTYWLSRGREMIIRVWIDETTQQFNILVDGMPPRCFPSPAEALGELSKLLQLTSSEREALLGLRERDPGRALANGLLAGRPGGP
jgi:hypothetical protein